MSILDNFLQRRIEKNADSITEKVTKNLTRHLDDQLVKAGSTIATSTTGAPMGVKRYQFSQDMVNGGIQRKTKPGANISFEALRQFSIQHEISRACINFRKRQISGMEWGIVSADQDSKDINQTDQAAVKQFFKTIGGRGIGYREFVNRFIEDLMVLDAVALEKQGNRGGGLFTVIPIDGATIRLRVDDSGATPEPPETAYVQVIRGQVTAEWTDDEMLYDIMNPRNDTPYGLAPLESLIIIVTSSLKAGMYNLGYLTDNNVPEGLFTMPDTWTPQQIKDFQEYFDALMSGDESMTRRLKFMPQGDYTPTNKPDDMAFGDFNEWLMHLTCALFDVDPVSIGFSPKQGLNAASAAKTGKDISEDKGQRPLALFIEEIFTKIIQEDLGYPNLRFDFPALREKDALAQATVNQVLLNSGQRTIDELRTDDGLEPYADGSGGKPYINGTVTFIDKESMDAAAKAKSDAAEAATAQLQNANSDTPPDEKIQDEPAEKADVSFGRVINMRQNQIDELKKFRKFAVNKAKLGKAVRPFESDILSLETLETLNKSLLDGADITQIRKAFDEQIKDIEILNIDTALTTRSELLEVS